jgi:hypothetical protein
MAHPFHHAKSSAKRFGGKPEDYQALHDFMDSSKSTYASWQHRAILHNAFGIYIAERIFGATITNSDGKQVPTRVVAEQHVKEDLGWIPTVQDWMKHLGHEEWMTRGVQRLNLEE